MSLKVIRGEIVDLHVDAIVNPTDETFSGSGSIDMQVQFKCGVKLRKQLKDIGRIDVSNAIVTDAYNMNCKKIIHVCGPVYVDGKHKEIKLLEDTYINALNSVKNYNISSIAFPLISTGAFGFPKDLAVAIATNVFTNYLLENDLDIYLVVYDKESFGISKKVFEDIKEFIDDNYVAEQQVRETRRVRKEVFSEACSYSIMTDSSLDFDELSKRLEETFSVKLLKLIDERNLKDSDVYKKANVDRKLFSKIRSNENYTPSKKTAIALGIALELNFDELQDLLSRASYTLSKSNLFDVVIEGCIKNGIYSIFQINNILFEFDLPLLN